MTHWLRTMLGAIVIMALPCVAWSGDIRVGFINPMGPPEFWSLVNATMNAAASELGVDLDIRESARSHDRAIAIAKDFLAEHPPPDYLIATNDGGVGGEIIKLADAAHVKLILLNNDLDPKDRAEYGEPRTKHPNWLGIIVADQEGAGYAIAMAILDEAAKFKAARPLKLLALAGDAQTPASVERVRGLKRGIDVMNKLLPAGSAELTELRHLDGTEKAADASVREFIKTGQRIDALWAANASMALGALTSLSEHGDRPGRDVLVGGLNWSQAAIDRVRKGEMVLTYGGDFLLGAWAMVLLRDFHDGRDFAQEGVRLQAPMSAIDLAVARRLPEIGKVDWRKVDFTRFSKTRNPAVKRYEFSPEAVLTQLQPGR